MSEITLRTFKPEILPVLRELIPDSFTYDDFCRCLEEFPHCSALLFMDDILVGAAVFTGADRITSFTLYIKESHRLQGYGTVLLLHLEKQMRDAGVQEIYCDLQETEKDSEFLRKHGYLLQFRSNYMVHQNLTPPIKDERIRTYREEDYELVHDIFQKAFQKMRRELGLPMQANPPSPNEAADFLAHRDSLLVLEVNGDLKACMLMSGNEVDKLAVEPSEERKGYGKALLHAGITHIRRNHDHTVLWVVEGNPAIRLYEACGFSVERLHSFYKKALTTVKEKL